MTHFCFSCSIKMPEVSAQNSDLQLLCRGPAPEPRRHSPSRSTPANSTSRSFKNGLQPNPDEEHSGGRRPAGCDSLWLSRYDQRSHTAGASSDSPEPRLTRDRFSSTDKLANCCKSVSVSMIQEPITGYMIQKPHPPCVPAVMWVTHLWQRRQRLCLWFWQFKELCLLLPAAFRRQQEFTASISKLTGSKPRSSHSSRFKKRWRSSFLSPAPLLLIPFLLCSFTGKPKGKQPLYRWPPHPPTPSSPSSPPLPPPPHFPPHPRFRQMKPLRKATPSRPATSPPANQELAKMVLIRN